jgi:hypothetical protein
MTAVEFFTNKLKALHPHKEVVSLSQELITAEEGLRWAQEFNQLHLQYLKNNISAVEWFLTELKRMQYFIGNDMLEAYNQALEMERHQKEKMYSEEELREAFRQSRMAKIFEKGMPPVYENFEQWFEQFKKK